ncbi:MAG: LIC12162 family transferase, partial [Syntrophales bacterium]
GIQHGGNYGIDECMKSLDHEVAITDKFYSWGWTYPELHKKIVPMPACNMIGNIKFKKNKKSTRILFAGAAQSRYLYRMEYPDTNYGGEKYCQDQIKFFKRVDINYQKYFSYRPFIEDFGLDILQRIRNECPDLMIEEWDTPFQESLMNCRLFVCDHVSTVHAEALSLNKPTIMFWDPESYVHRIEAKIYLENLHAAGILHYSPESAARMVNKVYDNIDDWWNERERQSARLEFCDKFARSSPNAVDEWASEFRKIIR